MKIEGLSFLLIYEIPDLDELYFLTRFTYTIRSEHRKNSKKSEKYLKIKPNRFQ